DVGCQVEAGSEYSRADSVEARKTERIRQPRLYPKPRIHPAPVRLLAEQQIVRRRVRHFFHFPGERLRVATIHSLVVQVKSKVVHLELPAESGGIEHGTQFGG